MPVVNRPPCAECSSPDVAYLRTRSPAAGTLRDVTAAGPAFSTS